MGRTRLILAAQDSWRVSSSGRRSSCDIREDGHSALLHQPRYVFLVVGLFFPSVMQFLNIDQRSLERLRSLRPPNRP